MSTTNENQGNRGDENQRQGNQSQSAGNSGQEQRITKQWQSAGATVF